MEGNRTNTLTNSTNAPTPRTRPILAATECSSSISLHTLSIEFDHGAVRCGVSRFARRSLSVSLCVSVMQCSAVIGRPIAWFCTPIHPSNHSLTTRTTDINIGSAHLVSSSVRTPGSDDRIGWSGRPPLRDTHRITHIQIHIQIHIHTRAIQKNTNTDTTTQTRPATKQYQCHKQHHPHPHPPCDLARSGRPAKRNKQSRLMRMRVRVMRVMM